jgi:sec-independent protein translocase protein TatB
MFDVGWSELVVIGVVALIAIGPKELPGVLRSVGQWVTKIRSMAAEFQGQFQEAMREAEMADLKKEVDNITGNLNTPFDPAKAIDSNWTPDKPAGSDVATSDVATAPPAGDDTATPASTQQLASEPPASEPPASTPPAVETAAVETPPAALEPPPALPAELLPPATEPSAPTAAPPAPEAAPNADGSRP